MVSDPDELFLTGGLTDRRRVSVHVSASKWQVEFTGLIEQCRSGNLDWNAAGYKCKDGELYGRHPNTPSGRRLTTHQSPNRTPVKEGM